MGVVGDLKPRGSKKVQYQYLRELWKNPMGRLVLSLSAASPALEPLGVPTVVLHIAGPSGIGKSCLCRLGIALYGDPRGSLLRVDIAKHGELRGCAAWYGPALPGAH